MSEGENRWQRACVEYPTNIEQNTFHIDNVNTKRLDIRSGFACLLQSLSCVFRVNSTEDALGCQCTRVDKTKNENASNKWIKM